MTEVAGDESEVRARWWHPAKGDVVFDVGCATGLWSIPAMKAGAYVYAFDPDPLAIRTFCGNAVHNGFTAGDFSIRNVAIGARNDDAWSIRDAWLNMGVPFSVIADYVSRLDFGGRMVKLRRLDHFERNTTRLDWIKIDVEGFEYDVICGATGLLKKYHPKLIVENHSNIDHIGPYAASKWPALVEALHIFDYETTEMPYGNNSGHLYAEFKR